MLETKLEELKAEIVKMTAALTAFTGAISVKTEAKSEAVPEATVEAAPAPANTANISREDLQEQCMVIVRNDRAKKTAVKDAIHAFGGATTLKDVVDSDLVALKSKLDALS